MKLVRDEFEKLALEHLDMLYRIARRLTRDTSRAEDLVQETYLRALRAGDNFELKEFGIRPWLVRIMHNLHYSRSERERRQPKAMDEVSLEGSGAGYESSPIDPSSLEGMDEHLVKALGELPEDYQTVMLLWAVDELSYKEIAHACDVPIGTVMSRLHRARQKLSEKLHDFAKKERIIRE